jgi:hypothetical protein
MDGTCTTYFGEEECVGIFLCVNLKERDNLKQVEIDGRGILKRILKKRDGKAWT